MVANRAYKFRIYPNDEQKILFAKTFGCVRMVYNHWLDRKIRQYEENKTNVTYTICAKEMAAMKKTEEYGFLKEADSIALQQSLRHLDTAFQNFFKQPKTGFPRFKSKKRNKNSYSTLCINGNIPPILFSKSVAFYGILFRSHDDRPGEPVQQFAQAVQVAYLVDVMVVERHLGRQQFGPFLRRKACVAPVGAACRGGRARRQQ